MSAALTTARLTATERDYLWRNRNGLLWRWSVECGAWQFYSEGEQCWIGDGAQMGPANDFGPFTQVSEAEIEGVGQGRYPNRWQHEYDQDAQV